MRASAPQPDEAATATPPDMPASVDSAEPAGESAVFDHAFPEIDSEPAIEPSPRTQTQPAAQPQPRSARRARPAPSLEQPAEWDRRVRVPAGQAVRTHWRIVVSSVAAFVLLALVAALGRSPTYTAETRLNVGRVDVNTSAIPGLVAGIQTLASTYSRTVNAQAVVEPVAKNLGLSPGLVASRLSASPIPDSPIFRIIAKAPSSASAVELANAASSSLIAYTTQLNSSDAESESLLNDYRQATVDLTEARQAKTRASNEYGRSATRANLGALNAADADVGVASLRVRTLADAYVQSLQGRAQSDLVQVLNPASDASSDRGAVFQRMSFLGIVVGLLVGIVLATLRANGFGFGPVFAGLYDKLVPSRAPRARRR